MIHFCPCNSLGVNKVLPSPAVIGAASPNWRALLGKLLSYHRGTSCVSTGNCGSTVSAPGNWSLTSKTHHILRCPQNILWGNDHRGNPNKVTEIIWLDKQLSWNGMDSNWEPYNYISNSLCEMGFNDFLDVLAVSTAEEALMCAFQVAFFVQLPHLPIYPWSCHLLPRPPP